MVSLLYTVIIMILSRYRYRPVTVPLQFTVLRYGPLPFFLKGYRPLPFVTDRDTSGTCVTERYKRYIPLQALQNVTDRY